MSLFSYLVSGDSYGTMASSFHVGVSTVATVVPEVVTEFRDGLVGEFSVVPFAEDWRGSINGGTSRIALNRKHGIMKLPPILFSHRRGSLHHSLGSYRYYQAVQSDWWGLQQT